MEVPAGNADQFQQHQLPKVTRPSEPALAPALAAPEQATKGGPGWTEKSHTGGYGERLSPQRKAIRQKESAYTDTYRRAVHLGRALSRWGLGIGFQE